LKNLKNEGKQMTTRTTSTVGAPSAKTEWQSIDWKTAKEYVNRLQVRIAKAIKLGHYNKAKALQWILTHSFYAKLLAVKRVTQNKGKNTPGIDHVIWRTPRQKMRAVYSLKRRGYKASPLRRIYIPKKNGKLRPLGIPTMLDRGMQALHLLALEPISETLADKNSYGFRPKRSLHDAIGQSFKALSHKISAQWILEGDIKACFDTISHTWLRNNVIMDKKILEEWLGAGFMDKDLFHTSLEGTPQGGIASPCLANIALDGLEKAILALDKPGNKLHFVRYADDWICTASSREILEEKVLPEVVNFLKERGLELSQEKTLITHINEGFDFLGFNLRKYKQKLLIKPGKKGIKAFLTDIREVIKRTNKTGELIHTLNLKIQGWANHNRHVVSKKIFSTIDSNIFKSLWRWAKRRHPNKSFRWVKKKYFTQRGRRDWVFFARQKTKSKEEKILTLKFASDTAIKRHVKIRSDANPYDPQFKEYFKNRETRQRMNRYNRVA
jgi:RNA-directed DNA polymerase